MLNKIKNFIQEWKLGEKIKKELKTASNFLPRNVEFKSTTSSFDGFEEFLEHDEFELALEQLQEMGDDLSEQGLIIDSDFWKILSELSSLMEMDSENE